MFEISLYVRYSTIKNINNNGIKNNVDLLQRCLVYANSGHLGDI